MPNDYENAVRMKKVIDNTELKTVNDIKNIVSLKGDMDKFIKNNRGKYNISPKDSADIVAYPKQELGKFKKTKLYPVANQMSKWTTGKNLDQNLGKYSIGYALLDSVIANKK